MNSFVSLRQPGNGSPTASLTAPAEEVIDTAPKLRPNTLDTSSTSAMMGLASRSSVTGLDLNTQSWNEMKERLKSPMHGGGGGGPHESHHKRWSREGHTMEFSSSAPQTPNVRSGRSFQVEATSHERTRKYGTGVRPCNSESEDSKRIRSTGSTENKYDENHVDGRASHGSHPPLRHVHSDSGGASSLLGKYRLSPEILKDR